MNVAHLNFAHGDLEEHGAAIADVRAAARGPRRQPDGYSLNLTLATWSSLLVEMSGVKSTRGPTRV